MTELRLRASPNHGPRPERARIDTLILHYTGMPTFEAALERLCDPAAQVSAHYLIAEDGTAWRLVDEERRAWHAGRSSWRGEGDINSRSIGIELANPGHEHGYRPFPEKQLAALEALAREILARHPIPSQHVLGHSDVAPERKMDPGELFPWERLARAGIGMWPNFAAAPRVEPRLASAQQGLRRIGYEIGVPGEFDGATRCALIAFQRHFRPERCNGVLDGETATRIAAVARGMAPA